jgi:hypothetical protein
MAQRSINENSRCSETIGAKNEERSGGFCKISQYVRQDAAVTEIVQLVERIDATKHISVGS